MKKKIIKDGSKIKATKKELFYNDFSDKWASEINNLETNKRLDVVFRRLLSKKDLKNKKFLEVGCGMGYFSEMAFKNGAKVTGIDVGNKLVAMTKKRVSSGKFLTASASNLPFRNESFDVVLCTEVIEHVDQQFKSVKELARVLKKGGILVITTPNRIFKPFFDFLSFIKIRPYHGNESWIYQWDLKRMLADSGLTVDKECFFNFIFPHKILDKFEQFYIFRFFMINYGFRLKKN